MASGAFNSRSLASRWNITWLREGTLLRLSKNECVQLKMLFSCFWNWKFRRFHQWIAVNWKRASAVAMSQHCMSQHHQLSKALAKFGDKALPLKLRFLQGQLHQSIAVSWKRASAILIVPNAAMSQHCRARGKSPDKTKVNVYAGWLKSLDSENSVYPPVYFSLSLLHLDEWLMYRARFKEVFGTCLSYISFFINL